MGHVTTSHHSTSERKHPVPILSHLFCLYRERWMWYIPSIYSTANAKLRTVYPSIVGGSHTLQANTGENEH